MTVKLKPDEERAYANYVHTPTESNNALLAMAKKMHGSRGVSSGSRVLDRVMIPTRGPWVRIWVAAPGNGKSTQLRTIAMTEARRLVEDGLSDKFYVAHITYEEAVDAQEIHYQMKKEYTNEQFWRGEVEPSRIIKGGLTRPDLPIYFLGESMMKSNINSPPMTIDMVMSGMRAVYKIEGKLPSVIVLDYAQEIVVTEGGSRTEKIIEAMRQVMRMGTLTGCAIEMGVQAKQVVLDKNPPIPDQGDIEWAFFLYQKATNAVALWRPWVTHREDARASENGIVVSSQHYALSPNLVVARPLKHRPGLLRETIPFLLDPGTLEVKDYNHLL